MHRVLLVDDEVLMRDYCKQALRSWNLHCDEAVNGTDALRVASESCHDLVLLDIDMPEMTGDEVCRHLRDKPPCPHLKVIMFSGRASGDEMAEIMLTGADDYLAKPFTLVQLEARVKAALRLKDAQDRSDVLNRQLLGVNRELEQTLTIRDSDLVQARNAMVLALAELVGYRDRETGAHLMRLQRYCRCLAEAATNLPSVGGQLDANFIHMLECCAPLHDMGKAGLPDHILLKPGTLTLEERLVMQSHTTIGAATLQKVAREHGFARAFLQMGIEITRHHHERYDGQGYPDRLSGDDIPLSARIVAIADVYDALRSRRSYKPAMSHAAARRMMAEEFSGHFDPSLAQVFQEHDADFERVYRGWTD